MSGSRVRFALIAVDVLDVRCDALGWQCWGSYVIPVFSLVHGTRYIICCLYTDVLPGF